MCDYKIKYWDYEEKKYREYNCPHRSIKKMDEDGKKFCIFHSRKEDKDVKKFYKGFTKLYEDGKHNFTGFIFPEDFDFEGLRKKNNELRFVDAIFRKATFLCEADFREAKFTGEGKTYFSWVKFSGKKRYDFSNTHFSSKGGVYFRGAEFSDDCEVIFHETIFNNKSDVYFTIMKIGKDVKITFDGVDLNGVRFLITDLRKINFIEVDWVGKKPDSSSYFGRLKVYDEVFQKRGFIQRLGDQSKLLLLKLKEDSNFKKGRNQSDIFLHRKIAKKIVDKLKINRPKKKEKNHYEVYRLYNQLIKNYEDTNRYHEAGDFFVGVMEMRRLGRFEKRSIRMLLGPYKWISLYGERPVKALCWLVGLILLFGLIYGNIIGVLPKNNIVQQVYQKGVVETTADKYAGEGPYDNYLNGLNLSLNYLTFGKVETPHKLRYTRYGFLLQAAEVVFGAVLLSLFILAMNRKFRRMKD